MVGTLDASRCHPALAASLYTIAREAVAQRRAEARPLHRGYWVVDAQDGAVLGFVALAQGLHAVLGRHTEAQVRVSDRHANVSLRQALLRVRDQDGALTLNMLDLESSNGITLFDGRRVRALDATGPFAATLGERMMFFLPEAPGVALPDALPVPELYGVAERVAAPGARRGNGLVNLHQEAGVRPERRLDGVRTLIVAREGSRHPSEGSFLPARVQERSHVEVDLDVARQSGASAFAVSLNGQPVGTLVLTAEQLREGVLLGRADRCWDLGDQPLPSSLSRVHALLLHEHGRLRVTDLASTNGTTLHGEPIRSARWEPGQPLELGGDLELEPLFVGPASET
jgi:hypothetical protein